MFAARVGDLASAKLLVAAGANVNDADAWGVSATALAAHSGFRELVEFLLDKGADPNAATAGLHRAARRDHAARRAAWSRALLAHGADPQRAAADLDADPAVVERLQLRARAGRRDAVLAGGPLHAAGRDAPARRARRRSAVRASQRQNRGRQGRSRLRPSARSDDRADGGGRDGRRRDRVGAARSESSARR